MKQRKSPTFHAHMSIFMNKIENCIHHNISCFFFLLFYLKNEKNSAVLLENAE